MWFNKDKKGSLHERPERQGNLGLLLSHIKDYVLMNYARNKDIWKTKIISI
jgi:hypothetical protein